MNSNKQTEYLKKQIAWAKKAAENSRRQQDAVILFEKLVQDNLGPLF